MQINETLLNRLLENKTWEWVGIAKTNWLAYVRWQNESNNRYIANLLHIKPGKNDRARNGVWRILDENTLLNKVANTLEHSRLERAYFVFWYVHATLFDHYRGAGCWDAAHRVQLEILLNWRNAIAAPLLPDTATLEVRMRQRLESGGVCPQTLVRWQLANYYTVEFYAPELATRVWSAQEWLRQIQPLFVSRGGVTVIKLREIEAEHLANKPVVLASITFTVKK